MTTFNISDPTRPTIDKAANAVLDYTWDWTSWLGTDTIATATVTVDQDLTTQSTTVSNGHSVTAIISGGANTPVGTSKRAVCKITTTNGRTEERSIYLKIAQR